MTSRPSARRAAGRSRAAWGVLVAALAAAVMMLGACTNVPTTSAPEKVRSLGDISPSAGSVTCPRDAIARTVVTYVLSSTDGPGGDAAGACMVGDAKSQQNQQNRLTTIISDPTTSNLRNGKITVFGNEVGTISPEGAYTPKLNGDGAGNGGFTYQVTYTMRQVGGQWRISGISPAGQLITTTQFQNYQSRDLYFFDLSLKRLVPVPVYTDVTDAEGLVRFLIRSLIDAQTSDTNLQSLASALPAQTQPNRVPVSFPDPSDGSGIAVHLDIPGALSLADPGRTRLAVQLAQTLEPAGVGSVAITDRNRVVRVDGSPSFSPAAILAGPGQAYLPDSTSGALYYVAGYGLSESSPRGGHPVAGAVGLGAYYLNSVAVALPPGAQTLAVAGVIGTGRAKRLDIGTQYRLRPTGIAGDLSRPAWSPGGGEAWVGDGKTLYRVTQTGTKITTTPVQIDYSGGSAAEPYITAVRVSPEGARIALVLSSSPASSTSTDLAAQIWVGTIVRTGGRVRIDGLTAISPQGVHITDVAWYDTGNLFAIGTALVFQTQWSYEVQVDGSDWTEHSTPGLPGPGAPDALTVSSPQEPVVSVDNSLWHPDGSEWLPLVGQGTTGTNPVYVE